MKKFEIQLKSGVAVVQQDEIDELIQTLIDIKQKLPEQTYADNAEAYVTHEMARTILRHAFTDEVQTTRRLGRLWSAIVRFAMDHSIAFDAYCRVCSVKLAEHRHAEEICHGMDSSSANAVVSRESLRNCRAAFMRKTVPGVGSAVKDDYTYLVAHLSSV